MAQVTGQNFQRSSEAVAGPRQDRTSLESP